jgi:hypothetical protein
MKVPYEPTPIRAVGTHDPVLIYRPMIHVRVIGPKGNVRLFGRIDTGADDSLFPEAIADELGVEFRRGQYEPLRLPGGGVAAARYSEVDLEIRSPEGPYRWAALVGFHQGNSTLLGLAGFLEWFTAIFDGRNRELTLRYTGNAPQPRYERPVPRPPRRLPRKRGRHFPD